MSKDKFVDLLFIVATIVMACLIALMVIVRNFYFETEIVGLSMAETLQNGETIIAAKKGEAKRGQIVILKVPETYSDFFSGEHLVKRVVAVEGDTIWIKNGSFYLQKAGETEGTLIEEDYVSSKNPFVAPITLSENEIYCLGDNRSISKDSSEVGPFHVEDIVGYLNPEGIEFSRSSFGSFCKIFI